MPSSSGASRFLALVVLLLFAIVGRAENIEVKAAAVTLREEGYSLDADFEITLTPTLEDILAKGVPLNFLVELEVIRPRWYWLNEKVVTLSQQYKLSYNPLTRQYRISIGTFYQNFSTLVDAVRFMGRLRNAPVTDKNGLSPGQSYAAAIRMRLDVSQLPKPFQITALGSRDWNLSSDWFRFPVSP